MRGLNYSENPVQQAYNGGDTVNVRQLQNFHTAATQNFSAVEQAVNTLETTVSALTHKLNASYEFIEWVQTHSPETLQAYKAHNVVTRAFDKAGKEEFVYPQTGGAA